MIIFFLQGLGVLLVAFLVFSIVFFIAIKKNLLPVDENVKKFVNKISLFKK